MPTLPPARVRKALARAFLGGAEAERLRGIPFCDAGHGYDTLGMNPDDVALAAGLLRVPYERYFRVQSRGTANIPASGPAILAANHGGMLPIDAAMIIADVLRHTDPPRLARAIGDAFIPLLPIVGTLCARMGMVVGSRSNFRHVLEFGDLVLVFPEGAPGIGKGFGKRYQLQAWRVGHAELSIRHGAPVVPVAVVGAEEAWPQLAKFARFHAFGAPHLPIPATPFPIPARFHISYGEPILLHERWAPEAADDPAVQREAADTVRNAVRALIARGLEEREGVFS